MITDFIELQTKALHFRDDVGTLTDEEIKKIITAWINAEDVIDQYFLLLTQS